MAEYRYVARDLRTGARLGELPLQGVTYTHDVETFGELTARVDLAKRTTTGRSLSSDFLGATMPRRSVIWVQRDETLMEGYIVWGRRTTGGGRWLTLRCASLWSYFHQRVLTVNKSYTNQDQVFIARDLVGWAQGRPAGDIRVGTPARTSGVNRTFAPLAYGYERRFIGQLVEQVARMDNGFEFAIDVALEDDQPVATFRGYYPRRGRRIQESQIVFFVGRNGNVDDYEHDEDGLDAVTTLYGIGAGEGSDMLLSNIADTAMLDQGYPLQEDVVTYKDEANLSNLNAITRAEARRRSKTPATWALSVKPDNLSTPLGSWAIGDDVRIIVEDNYRFPAGAQGEPGFDGIARILRQRVSPGDGGGPDAVTLELGPAFDG